MGLFSWFNSDQPKTATQVHAQTGSPKGGGRKRFSSNASGKPKVRFVDETGKKIKKPKK